MQRRTFFKASGALVITLIAWRQGVLVPAEKIRQKIPEFYFLQKKDISFLEACLPCILPFKQWDVETMAMMSSHLDATIKLMEPSVQKEIRQLFDLFHMPPLKLWLGLPLFKRASVPQMENAIVKLRASRVSDLRAAGLALGEILTGVYYSNPETDEELGYAPPLEAL